MCLCPRRSHDRVARCKHFGPGAIAPLAITALVLFGFWPISASASSLVGVSVAYTSATNQYLETQTFSDGSTTTSTGAGQSVDISSAIAANVPIVLSNVEATILLTTPSTEYDAVISGNGTLEISQNVNPSAASGTGATILTQSNNGSPNPVANGASLTFTAVQTLSLPISQATETISGGVVSGLNAPVLTIDPGMSVVFSNNGTTSANLILADASGQINFDNILNNGTLVYAGLGNGPLIGAVSGTGSVSAQVLFFHGSAAFSGVLDNEVQMFFGSSHNPNALPNASAIINNGSLLVSSPPGAPFVIPQNIYESHFGDDINTDTGTNIFLGVYSNSNNTARPRPNLVNPGLVDPSQFGTVVTGTLGVTGNPADFNFMVLAYSGANFTSLTLADTNATQGSALSDGGNASFRGINIEGGVTQWGNGTTNTFFLPATPDNCYINLHNHATLAIDYSGSSGPVTLNVPIGGGAINASLTTPGVGTVHIMNPTGGHANVVFSQPMFYNGATIIDAGATLQLGAGKPIVTYAQTIELEKNNSINYDAATVHSTYSGDSLLLIAQTVPGDATDSIIDNGALIVNNTENPITLSNITGTGQVIQSSQPDEAALSGVPDTAASTQSTLLGFLSGSVHPATPTLTLTGNNTYTGGTTVTAGASLIVDGLSALGGIGASLANRGIVTASAGTLTIHVPGDYTQASAAPTLAANERDALPALAFLAGSELPSPRAGARIANPLAARRRGGPSDIDGKNDQRLVRIVLRPPVADMQLIGS